MSFLTPRLFAIAKMVELEDVVADIGTDHAYLPIYLAKDSKAKRIYACDINEKPLEVAKSNIRSFGVTEKVETILSDGLTWLADNPTVHINACIMAGMGSNTILDILARDSNQVDCYIIASNTNLEPVRAWARAHKYFIEQEVMVEDNEIIYEIIKVNKFAGHKIKSRCDLVFGPILRREASTLFVQKWIEEESKLINLLHQIPRTDANFKKIQKKQKLLHKYINKELKQNERNKR